MNSADPKRIEAFLTTGEWPTRKPHLRLHYTPAGKAGNRSGMFPWSVEYVRGLSPRARRETYQHATVGYALRSAALLWF